MEKNDGCKNKFISFEKLNSKYSKLILISIGLYILIVFLLFLTSVTNIDDENEQLETINFMSFLFFINLGESLMIIPHLILKKNITSKKNYTLTKEKTNDIEKYIFNQKSPEFSKKEKIYFILFSIVKLSLDIAYFLYISKILYQKKGISFINIFSYTFQFELIFLYLLSKLVYKINFYKHQYISIIILTIFAFIKLIFLYVNDGISFLYHLLFHIAYSYCKAMMILYYKGLMEYKFFSPYKICLLFSIFSLLIVTIIYIILSFSDCNENENCTVSYNGNKYLANILTIFNLPGLFMFLFLLVKAVLTVINYIIVHDFSVCHTIMIIHLSQIIEIQTFFAQNDVKDILYIIFVVVFIYILGTVFVLLFLEIIEINVCGLSYNTKKNIEKRAILDMESSNVDDDNIDAVEEIEGTNEELEEI